MPFFGAKARKTLVKYLMKRGEMHPDAPLWTNFNKGERLTDWGHCTDIETGLLQLCKNHGQTHARHMADIGQALATEGDDPAHPNNAVISNGCLTSSSGCYL